MHIHILGICGTFMGGVAQLAQAMGHSVSGSDQNVYPPMSTQLSQAGIELMQGYDPEHLRRCNAGHGPDQVVIGNAMSRGNPMVEAVLNQGLSYVSGPQWLAENVLQNRWVLAVAGTHGKTTTASLLAWILEAAGLAPGFLIGGVPNNFNVSARLGQTPFFVIEADEYDTAFFDKRSKFVHYRPRTVILNNLEYDHADIFPDLEAIKRQFHHLLRIVPGEGLVIANGQESQLDDVLARGCWTPVERFGLGENVPWRAVLLEPDGRRFTVTHDEKPVGSAEWSLLGVHNVLNALAAMLAARHAGVAPESALQALRGFAGVKRRLEVRGRVNDITVYDDFAHHPTAIELTLAGLRNSVGPAARIIAVLELRSNTMRMGVHNSRLLPALDAADDVWLYAPGDSAGSGPEALKSALTAAAEEKKADFPEKRLQICGGLDDIVLGLCAQARPGDHILVMSNGGFGGLHDRLLSALRQA
jgi:UDP-N-acetylmuramate: L-alanyl-gamma-D-glutamyl-meso-diaminopimelate ligase